LNRSYQLNDSYFEFEEIVHADGLCGNLQVPPIQRSCTPPLHIHLNQTEYFTLVQGQVAYQMGDKVYSCDIHTCPRPLIVPPLLPHTFWMDNNKEDLIVLIRVEPAIKYGGIRQEFFETYGGAFRDQYISIWQIFVLFENAQTYPASLPLPLAKVIFKIGSLIGQLLGFKTEYEEYTTITDEFN
jgi:hypothetical protein